MPTLSEIRKQWDRNAASRCRQLDDGIDISHDRILLPWMIRLAGNLTRKKAVDVGCGCGFLTRAIAKRAASIIGIDISSRMIAEASRRHHAPNLTFRTSSVREFARECPRHFDVCFANMSIMTMPSLDSALSSIAFLLKKGGLVIFSVTHPCFWNSYRSDEPASSFRYEIPHPVTAPFRISLAQKPLPAATSYFHRSMSEYVNSLSRAGFHIQRLAEPGAPVSTPAEYRRSFHFPRFMLFRSRKM